MNPWERKAQEAKAKAPPTRLEIIDAILTLNDKERRFHRVPTGMTVSCQFWDTLRLRLRAPDIHIGSTGSEVLGLPITVDPDQKEDWKLTYKEPTP